MATSAPQTIAGFVDEAGELTDLFGPGVVRIFHRRSGSWQPDRDLGFTLDGATSLGTLRTKLHGLADEMAPCQVLLVGQVKGVLPALLGEKGVAVSQVSGNALGRLAQVPLEDPVAGAPAASGPAEPAPVAPTEVEGGIFRLDLAAAMGDNPRLTSRQILIPLLSKGGFTLLEVLCEHPPRWLDTDGRKLGYGYESAPRENPRDGFVVTLYPDADACASAEACSVLTSPGGCGSGGCGSRHSEEFVDL